MPRELPPASKTCSVCNKALHYYGRRDLLELLQRVQEHLDAVAHELQINGAHADPQRLAGPLLLARGAIAIPLLNERPAAACVDCDMARILERSARVLEDGGGPRLHDSMHVTTTGARGGRGSSG